MKQEKFQWNIRHILKDGSVLGSEEKLPITKESLEAFRQYGEIAMSAAARLRAEEPIQPSVS